MEGEAGGAGIEYRKKENGSASNIERRRGPIRQLQEGAVGATWLTWRMRTRHRNVFATRSHFNATRRSHCHGLVTCSRSWRQTNPPKRGDSWAQQDWQIIWNVCWIYQEGNRLLQFRIFSSLSQSVNLSIFTILWPMNMTDLIINTSDYKKKDKSWKTMLYLTRNHVSDMFTIIWPLVTN